MVIFVNGEEVGGGGGGGGGDLGVLDDVGLTVYVSKAAGSTKDGSAVNPFLTITEAEDYVDTLVADGTITSANRATIKVGPGVYVENVYHRAWYTLLDLDVNATIAPTSGLHIYMGNATKASVAAMVAMGATLAGFDANYGTLVADPNILGMHKSAIRGGNILYHTLASPVFAYIGVGNGFDTAFNGAERYMHNTYFVGVHYFRNASKFEFRGGQLGYFSYFRQIRSVVSHDADIYALYADFNTSDPRPAAPYDTVSFYTIAESTMTSGAFLTGNINYGGRDNTYVSSFQASGTSVVTLDDESIRDIVLADDVTFTQNGGQVWRDCAINGTGTPTINFNNCNVNRNMTVAAGGTKVINFLGGEVYGSLTDPDDFVVFRTALSSRAREISIADVDSAGVSTLISKQVDNTTIIVDASAAAQVVNLPVLTSAEAGFETTIKCDGAFGCTPTAGSGQTIDGAATFPLADKEAVTLRFSGTTIWRIV